MRDKAKETVEARILRYYLVALVYLKKNDLLDKDEDICTTR